MTDSAVPRPIQLDQFLKLTGAVSTGGHAKLLIQSGEVLLNGEVETRRRKKLAPGDTIEVLGEQYIIEKETDETGQVPG